MKLTYNITVQGTARAVLSGGHSYSFWGNQPINQKGESHDHRGKTYQKQTWIATVSFLPEVNPMMRFDRTVINEP